MSQSSGSIDFAGRKLAEIDEELEAVDLVAAELQGKRKTLVAMREALLPLVSKTAAPTSPQRPAPAASAAPPVNTGFRNAVRVALKEHPKGLKPAELIQLLSDRGDLAKYTGRVKPKDRVYAELYALKQSGELSKRYGRYVYIHTEATNGQA